MTAEKVEVATEGCWFETSRVHKHSIRYLRRQAKIVQSPTRVGSSAVLKLTGHRERTITPWHGPFFGERMLVACRCTSGRKH
jgi:hypothetical protein